MQLRPYQQRTIDQLYEWFRENKAGNPCLVLPTGAGKSLIIAALCRDALQSWPETRILMLTHVKELIEQNAQKMRALWYNAPMGIYSASIGKKQAGEPITFAGIQSVRSKAAMLGHIDIVIIDECHLIGHKDEGGYRSLLRDLVAINPNLRIVGLTATPYRLGHGLITDKPALFDALIEPVSIEELLHLGYLAPLRSKVTDYKIDVSGIHKRGGEFIEGELAKRVDTVTNNLISAREIIARADGRKSWLVFCTGVHHAEAMAETLRHCGIVAKCVTGKTSKAERARILEDFKAGRVQALTNANVLTTGFDAPGTDLIAMLRPTASPGLYVQMAGRGLRTSPGKTDCLVLDFAGNIATHGPIVAVRTPTKSGDGDGDAPVKTCPNCGELAPASIRICPDCGFEFPKPEPKQVKLHDDCIMGLDDLKEMHVRSWRFSKHTSRASGKDMIKITYYGDLSDTPVKEYLTIYHDGWAGQKAIRTLGVIAASAGIAMTQTDDCAEWCAMASKATPPAIIKYRKDGKFFNIVSREWNHEKA